MLITINDLGAPPRELELPLYRRIDTSNDRFEVNWYSKVEERGGQLRRLEICLNGLTGINLQIVQDFSFDGVTRAFILGEDGYRVSDATEFAWALEKVREVFDEMHG